MCPWLERESELLRPELIVPVGRFAIQQFLPARSMVEQIGKVETMMRGRRNIDLIPRPLAVGLRQNLVNGVSN